MPPQKKQRLHKDAAVATDDGGGDNSTSAIDRLGTDAFAHIFGFLPSKDIMRARLNNKMRLAAKKTIVPDADFRVYNQAKYNCMAAMTSALPGVQHLSLRSLGYFRHIKYNDGEDPDEQEAARTANWTTLDIGIISSFRRLHSLEIENAPMNGKYSFLFNFPLLKILRIRALDYLSKPKWDLDMLSGVPLLKELHLHDNEFLNGNINSLRVLKGTIEKVYISNCCRVQGNFMDLADFPCLKELDLGLTSVTGDIRKIGEQDFLALETLILPNGVYGAQGYEFQNISDAPAVAKAVYSIKKQRPALLIKDWYAYLSKNSVDWYEGVDSDDERTPLFICLVEAGSRLGYRWESENGHSCEVIWLDQEPERDVESSDYGKYTEQLHHIESRVFFRGFSQPPTEEEYNLLCKTR